MVDVQTYENYRSITLAYTNFFSGDFIKFLKVCIDFIDNNRNKPYTPEKYEELQRKIHDLGGPTSYPSIRKVINEYLKLGFINSFLDSYHPDSKTYVSDVSLGQRKYLFSKILYSNSSFNRSVTEDSDIRQISFLLKTLMNIGSLTKEQIIGLMLVDVDSFPEDGLNEQQVLDYTRRAQELRFIERKYNQIGYLYNVLSKLDDVKFHENILYFKDDAEDIEGFDVNIQTHSTQRRDPYLYGLYKKQLKEESIRMLGGEKPKCMLEELSYPVLVASHIKPFIDSNLEEKYDPNNGILLSRTMDSMFDLGYISFNPDGTILCSPQLESDVVNYLGDFRLDNIFLNDKRKEYLEYHRANVLRP